MSIQIIWMYDVLITTLYRKELMIYDVLHGSMY
nr:MAG TPA: hypothetical protein [Caudoviricetes sp.]